MGGGVVGDGYRRLAAQFPERRFPAFTTAVVVVEQQRYLTGGEPPRPADDLRAVQLS